MGFSAWETPPDLFYKQLHSEFRFTLDAAASHENALLPRYFTDAGFFEDGRQTSELNGLAGLWAGNRVWCNPPYNHTLQDWVAKAASLEAELTLMLLPPSIDTVWFHRYIYHNPACRWWFPPGRIRFFRDGYAGDAPRTGNLFALFQDTSYTIHL